MTYFSQRPRAFINAVVLAVLLPSGNPANAQNDPFAELRVPPPGLEEIFSRQADDGAESLENSVAVLSTRRVEFGGDARAHVLVALSQPLTSELRDTLAQNGLEIIDRFDGNIWIARTNQQGLKVADDSGGFTAVTVMPPASKVSGLISLSTPYEWQKRESSDALGYSVLFHKGISADEATATLGSLINADIGGISKEGFQFDRSITIALNTEEVAAVAALDIVQFIEPQAPPDEDQNLLNTQPVSNVDDVQGPPYNLSGTGVTVGVWESGDVVHATHQDLTPRVTVEPGQTTSEDGHANHVAGTIGASGVNTPNAEGMAPAVNIRSWDSTSDTAEMGVAAAAAAANRPVASNHSYGAVIGWNNAGTNFTNNQASFGSYTNRSVAFDTVVAGDGVGVAGTELVILKSAGNDRNDGPNAGVNPDDCRQGGLGIDADCVGPVASAKNVITVGAMNGGALIAGFSGFGPTDDGRIKPDVVANGTNVLSLGSATAGGNDDITQTNTGTWTAQGTSMSAPALTGIVALMTEQINTFGLPLPTATAYKSILIQTARNVAGTGQSTVGPDFATGWGIADAQAAMDLLRRAGGPGFAEGTITATGAGGAWDFPFVVPAGQPELHVTLAWSDLPGTPAGAGSELVNDLDLRLIPPGGGTAQQPWTLNPANPGLAATRNGGDDAINNVEQVSVLTPGSGTWIARVTAKAGSLALGSQRFAIAGPITPETGPISGPKANIMMVLDKSGSMVLPAATPGLNKMAALQNGARAFVDYMELVGGHNLGVTAFDTGVVGTSPVVGLQTLDASAATDARTAIGNLNPGGYTGIIAGVTDAVGQLAGPNATNPGDVIVLFSDGRHNRPVGSNVNVIDGVMANDTRFFSIGYGTDVDSTVMPGVAANHDGVHLEEQTLQAGQLAKLFMVVGGLATDETIIIDPDYTLPAGASANQSVLATKADHSLTFATFWNEPQPERLRLQLFGPNKRCRVPMDQHSGFDMRTGTGYWLVRVDLPYQCQVGDEGALMHEGTWRLHMRNAGTAPDIAKVVVLSDSGVTLRVFAKAGGGKALITAQLIEGGTLLRKGVRVFANVRPNRPSTGDSEKMDAILDDPKGRPDKPSGRGGALTGFDPGITIAPAAGATLRRHTTDAPTSDRMMTIDRKFVANTRVLDVINERALKLQLSNEILGQLGGRFKLPVQPTGIELLDDGTNGDSVANDGVFSVMVSLPQKGLYQARVMATQARPEGKMTREGLTSFLAN